MKAVCGSANGSMPQLACHEYALLKGELDSVETDTQPIPNINPQFGGLIPYK